MANSAAPSKARIVATAKVGGVTQTNIMHVEMAFGWGAAIISDNPGSSATGTSKSVAQDGNVVVDGSTSATSTTVVDGGILANGRANTNACRLVPGQMMRGGQPFRASMSMTNRSTAFQIPDYTADGSADQLFDFDRFIAAAKASGNYFTNLTSFVNVMKTGVVLEGIVAVDVAKSGLPSLSPSTLPFGINIRGTLVFNFSSAYSPSDKVANTAAMNINPANLSGLIPGNPATYTTGYPPVYSNPAKNPANVDITSRGFANFTPYDDLPALMYNVGILDMHGPVNISGVVYSPSFMEHRKQAGRADSVFQRLADRRRRYPRGEQQEGHQHCQLRSQRDGHPRQLGHQGKKPQGGVSRMSAACWRGAPERRASRLHERKPHR